MQYHEQTGTFPALELFQTWNTNISLILQACIITTNVQKWIKAIHFLHHFIIVVSYSPFLFLQQEARSSGKRSSPLSMNIPAAWRRGYTGKNVVVTVLDDGIERVHPDLIENYVSLQLSATVTFQLLSHRKYLKRPGLSNFS